MEPGAAFCRNGAQRRLVPGNSKGMEQSRAPSADSPGKNMHSSSLISGSQSCLWIGLAEGLETLPVPESPPEGVMGLFQSPSCIL